MKQLKNTLVVALALLAGWVMPLKADKGMWLLNELTKQNIERMRELGFTMPMEELYDLSNPSLANAVVIFGGGCTGITVSQEGLVFTNHHCGYSAIQSQSAVGHDYLRDGFKSMSQREELPIPGLQVRYLKNIVDVTEQVNKAVAGINDELKREEVIYELGKQMAEQYTKGQTEGEMISYYAGNKYYVVVYDVFSDVRMVMAPPSSVGKFGGDTDNWMWTRHTGDFSVFRVYADANNQPAQYDPNNRPYRPKYFAKVSLDGYAEGDYAMTIGFPGSTERYLTSWGVENRIENDNNPRIEVRGAKQDIWRKAMLADQATRIQYASKYAQSSNYWKNSIGMNRGLKNLDVVARKKAEEKTFEQWIAKNNLQSRYGHILPDMHGAYQTIGALNKDFTYLIETVWSGTELPRLTRTAIAIMESDRLTGEKRAEALDNYYKDYSPALDREVMPAMIDLLRSNVPADKQPGVFKMIDKKFKGSSRAYADYVFTKSIFPYREKVDKFFLLSEKKQKKVLDSDPAKELMESVLECLQAASHELRVPQSKIDKASRELFAARRVMSPETPMPSDANFTMRLSYGSVLGYAPKDAAWYNYYTTERGIFEKQDPTSHEFAVQPEILAMLRSKDFGRYGQGGELRLCFLSNNDITGGNSGSPVFDGHGNLIGLAFDGNWEAMSGDIEFEPELQRTISVDIRYVLYMIDKWAGMKHVINELKIVEGDKPATPAIFGNGARNCKMSGQSAACCQTPASCKSTGKPAGCCQSKETMCSSAAKAKGCCKVGNVCDSKAKTGCAAPATPKKGKAAGCCQSKETMCSSAAKAKGCCKVGNVCDSKAKAGCAAPATPKKGKAAGCCQSKETMCSSTAKAKGCCKVGNVCDSKAKAGK